MQIHEITKTQINEALGDMVGDLIKGGIAKVMGGKGTPAEKLAAGQSAQIASLANRALAQWQAKQAQLSQTLGNVNFDEELEAWVEDNLLPGRLNVEDLDPAYKTQIIDTIKIVNGIPDTDLPKKRAAFQKLVATAVMSRPARMAAAGVRSRSNAAAVINAALAMVGTSVAAGDLRRIGDNFKAQGITSVPSNQVAQIAGQAEAQGVSTLLQAMGINVT